MIIFFLVIGACILYGAVLYIITPTTKVLKLSRQSSLDSATIRAKLDSILSHNTEPKHSADTLNYNYQDGQRLTLLLSPTTSGTDVTASLALPATSKLAFLLSDAEAKGDTLLLYVLKQIVD